MIHKCPYCLNAFDRNQANTQIRQNINYFYCPNPNKDENDRDICGKMLPLGFFEADSTTIAIVGGTGVGKTYYFLALLHQLKFNKNINKLGIQGDILGGQKGNPRLFSLIADLERNKTLDATSSSSDAVNTVIDLTITKNNRQKHIYLSFFDNPGEKFNDIDYMIDNFSNVFRADGLIFLVEPKQIGSFQQIIFDNYKYELNLKSTDFYTVVNNITKLLRHVKNNSISENVITSGFSTNWQSFVKKAKQAKNSLTSDKINTPIAFAISKFDQLAEHIHVNIPMDETQMQNFVLQNGNFDEDALNIISTELERKITEEPNGEISVNNHLRSNVANYAYFGVKSITVNNEGKPEQLEPQGTVLPLIWIFKQLKKM